VVARHALSSIMTLTTTFQYLVDTIQPSAKINPKKSYCHTAVLMKGNKILAVATNRSGTRSMGSGYSQCTIHAEMDCLKKVGDVNKLKGAVMFVWRFDRTHTKTMNSKPCQSCSCVLNKCMREYGLKNVFYTT
jgi:hypothetical protein